MRRDILLQELEESRGFLLHSQHCAGVHKTELTPHHVQVHTTTMGTTNAPDMVPRWSVQKNHLTMLHFLEPTFSVINSFSYKESKTNNFVTVSQIREKGIKLRSKMTNQICLTCTNSL